jgi:hypothetical protein
MSVKSLLTLQMLLKNIVTGDDTWVYGYDIGTKVQSSQWGLKSPPDPKKHGRFGPVWKCCWLCFFDCESVIHHEFLPHGQKVNKEYYLEVKKMLREAVRWKSLICGREKNGCFIMIMPPCIPPFLFAIFSQNIRQRSSPSLCPCQTCSPQTFVSSPSWSPCW